MKNPLIDTLIFGVPRSGTTLISNLMNYPPNCLSLIEPGFMRPGRLSFDVIQQLIDFGICLNYKDMRHWDKKNIHDRRNIITNCLYGWANKNYKKIAVKEVIPDKIMDFIKFYKPKQIVLMVRNIEDVAVSALELIKKQNSIPSRHNQMINFIVGSAKLSTQFVENWIEGFRYEIKCVIVKYERFVVSPKYRDEISKKIDWQFKGDLSYRLKVYNRGFENDRHKGLITSISIGRLKELNNSEDIDFVKEIVDKTKHYCSKFNYETN